MRWYASSKSGRWPDSQVLLSRLPFIPDHGWTGELLPGSADHGTVTVVLHIVRIPRQ
jgi:hypothetical protein